MVVRLSLLIASAALALVLTGCVEPSEGTPSSADLDAFGVQPTVTIEVDEAGFRPASVELAANSTVTVTNVGTDRHGLLETETQPDRRIETGDLVPGEAVDVHLADPGLLELIDPRTGETLTLNVGPAEPRD
jgi:plastocyanin